MRRIGRLCMVFSIAVAASQLPSARQAPDRGRLAAETAVYLAVLSDPRLASVPARGKSGLVIVDRTTDLQDDFWWKGSEKYGLAPLNLRTRVPGATQVLIDDFQNVLRTPVDLAVALGPQTDVAFLSRQRLNEIFRGPDGWENFYSVYPGSRGYLELSRVGLDDTAGLALVYAGHHYGLLGGVGAFVLLRSHEGGWTIVRWYGVWES